MTTQPPQTLLNVTIDGQTLQVPKGTRIIQACDQLGAEIPRFCYHDRLSVAGNCRMCLVEIEENGKPAPKPVASCAYPVSEGMKVFTQSARTQQARKNVMEMLLINHPLDCPICDQGGECDLQDIAVGYGSDRSRYEEPKRAVVDKDIGPLIKTVMTRCIHCTRCIRFATEIAGVQEMGATGRGEEMSVGTYVEEALASELSGNMIDLCPVGALTSKPYAFVARPWELKHTDSIDVMDAVGSNIRIDHRDGRVLRILPRANDDVNEEWLADTGRFAYDGLLHNRLTSPMVRLGKELKTTSWQEAFNTIKRAVDKTSAKKIAGLLGNAQTAEEAYAFNAFMKETLGTQNVDCRTDGAVCDHEARSSYIMNTPIAKLEEADLVILVGANPRLEAPLVNTRIRKIVRKNRVQVFNIGEAAGLTYAVTQLSNNPAEALTELAGGKSAAAKALAAAQKPVMIISAKAIARADGQKILGACRSIAEKSNIITTSWNGFNVLQQHAGRVAALDMGVVPGIEGVLATDIADAAEGHELGVLFIYGEGNIPAAQLAGAGLTVFIGTHNSEYAKIADVVLPAAAYTEKNGWWTNCEGRVQEGFAAVQPPLHAKEDWKIFRALSEVLGEALPFDSLAQLRAKVAEVHPAYQAVGEVVTNPWQVFGAKGSVAAKAFVSPVEQFYMTHEVMRASHVMRDCQDLADGRKQPVKKAG